MRLFINILLMMVVALVFYVIIGTIARSCYVSSKYVSPIEDEFVEVSTFNCEYVSDDGEFDCHGLFDNIVEKRDKVVEDSNCVFSGKWLVFASGNERLAKHVTLFTVCSPFWFL